MSRKAVTILMVIAFFFSVTGMALSAEKEKQPYKHILVLGADKPYSNAYLNKMLPIIAYYYFMEDFEGDLYGQFTLKTTNIYFILGLKNPKVFTGIKPQLNHHIYGAYQSYYKGVLDESRIFKSHNAGPEVFFKYNWASIFSTKLSYYAGFYFYQKIEEEDGPLGETMETEINLPDKHWEHQGSFEMLLGKVTKTDLGRIKHGIMLKGRYEYIRRIQYGTFEDRRGTEYYDPADPDVAEIEIEDSDIESTQKIYGNLGAYLNLSGFNLLLDVIGAIHYDVDRNNAEHMASFVADHAIMPGYFLGEFYHDRYLIARAQIGIPIPFWGARIQPGYNILYMPEENKVVGESDYPRTTYRSVSVDLSFKLGNVLPVFIGYAYGMDAKRIDIESADLKEEKGNHEVKFLILMAFGKN